MKQFETIGFISINGFDFNSDEYDFIYGNEIFKS